jgi:hypothetical protein
MVASRNVTLFKVTKANVIAYGDILPMMYFESPHRCVNSDDVFLEKQAGIQHNARVHRVSNTTFIGQPGQEGNDHLYLKDERFIAMDRDLEKIVTMFKDEAHDQGVIVGRRLAMDEIWSLKDEIKRLQSRTIWSMIVDKFKWSKR